MKNVKKSVLATDCADLKSIEAEFVGLKGARDHANKSHG